MGQIIIYSDEGVSGVSLKHLLRSLQKEVDTRFHTIRRIDAKELLSTDWEEETDLLLVPGGRDVFYQRNLFPRGTQKIKHFVEQGGRYFGLCAGAYFACDAIEFEKGGELEVCEERFLKFYPGLAKGPALGLNKYRIDSEQGAESTPVSWKGESCTSYFNGGCCFVSPSDFLQAKVLSHYLSLPDQPAAIVECAVGKGLAVLSGVHIEYTASLLTGTNPAHVKMLPELEASESIRRGIFRELLFSLQVTLSEESKVLSKKETKGSI